MKPSEFPDYITCPLCNLIVYRDVIRPPIPGTPSGVRKHLSVRHHIKMDSTGNLFEPGLPASIIETKIIQLAIEINLQ